MQLSHTSLSVKIKGRLITVASKLDTLGDFPTLTKNFGLTERDSGPTQAIK